MAGSTDVRTNGRADDRRTLCIYITPIMCRAGRKHAQVVEGILLLSFFGIAHVLSDVLSYDMRIAHSIYSRV